MRPSHGCGRALATALIAFGVGLAVAPAASADPSDPAPTDTRAPAPPAGAPVAAPAGAPAPAPPRGAPAPEPPAGAATQTAPIPDAPDPAAVDACKQFAAVLNFAAHNYEDFAYDSAGGGNDVNYDNPIVSNDNVIGRTALREAAAAAMTASATPGLQPDIAAPMQAWSLSAAKLIVVMGVRGGGDTLNSTATEMNTNAHNAQVACAQAGTHA
ncbi:MAG: hypothetical protein JOZ49_18475 [Mycolicibacterium sp.]|nr:hypothetical protein [Mycolicibacterium sp.]